MYFVMKWRCLCDKMSGFFIMAPKCVACAGPTKMCYGLAQQKCAWAAAKSMGWVVFNKQIGQILKNG